MTNYREYIQPLVNKGLVQDWLVFYFDEDELRDHFQSYFDFCIDHLKDYAERDRVGEVYFFFPDVPLSNARTYPSGDIRFIEVNSGSVMCSWNLYHQNADILSQPEYDLYRRVAAHSGITAAVFLHQYTTLYSYYHEYAHLIQHNDSDRAFRFEENLDEGTPADEVLQQHCKEFDADWLSATQLATHIRDYVTNEERDLTCSLEEIAGAIILGLASIFNYFALNVRDMPELYIRERSHPHHWFAVFMYWNLSGTH
jgi:hypothetical protein